MSIALVGNKANRPSLQGSVFWMAPEVVKQAAHTNKADIWSVGCLVVEMFTGEHPWAQLSQMQAIFKVRRAPLARCVLALTAHSADRHVRQAGDSVGHLRRGCQLPSARVRPRLREAAIRDGGPAAPLAPRQTLQVRWSHKTFPGGRLTFYFVFALLGLVVICMLCMAFVGFVLDHVAGTIFIV